MSLHEKLQQLYLLDKQVRGFQGRLDNSLKRLAVQKSKLEQSNQQHDELHAQLKQTQTTASSLENQSKDIEQRIERLRVQMQTVKSNKEYSAVLIEVNTLKEDKSQLEDQALAQLSEVDRLNEELQLITAQIEQQKKLAAGAETEVQTCRDEIGKELDELNVSRAAAELEIPSEARSVFNRMADNYEGEAMASVTEVSRRHREYTCNGCYMSIPVERVNALIIQQDQMILCPSCNRILFIEHELKASIGSK